MATNGKTGNNRRHGMVRERSQTQTPSGHWVKRDANTGHPLKASEKKKALSVKY